MAFVIWLSLILYCQGVWGLYPRESLSREIKELDGLWHFRADYSANRNAGFEEKWYEQPLRKSGDTVLMPVPSSFNDITQNSSLRDFVGWVWYDRQVWIPEFWMANSKVIKLQFASINYNAVVWVNGKLAMTHSGGHLPFEKNITSHLHSDRPNTITVAANNTLSPTTVPPGTLTFHDETVTQNVQMDFTNYAGILRPVKLYTIPTDISLEDVTIISSLNEDQSEAQIKFDVFVSGALIEGSSYSISVMTRNGDIEAASNGTIPPPGTNRIAVAHGTLQVTSPSLWWPWTMSDTPGFLYAFQVTLKSSSGITDIYRQPFGIRTVSVTSDNKFLINNKPFYFHGLGRHEDSDVRGRGFDNVLNMKDINLLMWLGANSFRTAVYPNSEELMDICDKYGIVVMDEAPAVGLTKPDNFSPETLAQHVQELTELVTRDKNRPSVVMWSLANEPDSTLLEAESYFKDLSERAKILDTRPITVTLDKSYMDDKVAQFMDVVSINRYYGWYISPGNLAVIPIDLPADLEAWYSVHNKPILMSEYGAGAISGTHEDPPTMYTENYQSALLSKKHFEVFDKYRKTFLIGELLWTFADFSTSQSSSRAHGNRKGVLTRQRQPKQAAYVIRDRYLSLTLGRNVCSKHSTKLEL